MRFDSCRLCCLCSGFPSALESSLLLQLVHLNLHDTVRVWISAATDRFILVLVYIHKTHDSLCNHRLVFSCYPKCTRFTILDACLCDTLINIAFPVITLLHLTPWPTGQIWPLLIVEEYIWIANVYSINGFVIYISFSVAPTTTTKISSTMASKSPSITPVSAASASIHTKDTDTAAATASLGGNPACLSG